MMMDDDNNVEVPRFCPNMSEASYGFTFHLASSWYQPRMKWWNGQFVKSMTKKKFSWQPEESV
jgi:hypothetical protein